MDFLAEQFQPFVFHGIDCIGCQARRVEAAGARCRLDGKYREAVAPGGLGCIAGVVGASQGVGHRGAGVDDKGDADACGELARRRWLAEVGIAHGRRMPTASVSA